MGGWHVEEILTKEKKVNPNLNINNVIWRKTKYAN